MSPVSRESLENAYLDACEIELQAFKPGNVSVHSEGHDMTVEYFRRSAQASAPFLCAPDLSLGEKIFQATKATREAAGCNTNLGILLLAAPLMQAMQTFTKDERLRDALGRILNTCTQADAEWAYQAIRLAAPGGLGQAEQQDVNAAPEVTLLQAMQIAAERDRIAKQYTNSYADVFDLAIPSYHYAMSRWGDEEWAAVAVFSALLKHFPDSHIERKFGTRHTRTVTDRMAHVEQALFTSDRPEQTLQLLGEVDAEFKSAGINPGTTADLTVTCLLVVRLEKLILS